MIKRKCIAYVRLPPFMPESSEVAPRHSKSWKQCIVLVRTCKRDTPNWPWKYLRDMHPRTRRHPTSTVQDVTLRCTSGIPNVLDVERNSKHVLQADERSFLLVSSGAVFANTEHMSMRWFRMKHVLCVTLQCEFEDKYNTFVACAKSVIPHPLCVGIAVLHGSPRPDIEMSCQRHLQST